MFDDAGKAECRCIDLIPPRPITDYLYRCDRVFHVDPLFGLYATPDEYGLVYVTGTSCRVYTFYINEQRVVSRLVAQKNVTLAKRHKKGGQSQHRIERLYDESHFNYITKVNELLVEHYIRGEGESIKGLVLAGSGHKKDNLQKRLDPRLKALLLGTVGCESEEGLFERCKPLVDEVEYQSDYKVINEFMDEFQRGTKAVQGVKYVKRALRDRMLAKLVIHEDCVDTLHARLAAIREFCQGCGCDLFVVRAVHPGFVALGGIGGIRWY